MDMAPLCQSKDDGAVEYAAEFGRVSLDFDGCESDHLGISNAWRVCAILNAEVAWSCSFFRIFAGDSERLNFVPGFGLEVYAVGVTGDDDEFNFWSGPKRRLRQARAKGGSSKGEAKPVLAPIVDVDLGGDGGDGGDHAGDVVLAGPDADLAA
eukprot:7334617-Pyramimonas_sp.AAC.1